MDRKEAFLRIMEGQWNQGSAPERSAGCYWLSVLYLFVEVVYDVKKGGEESKGR